MTIIEFKQKFNQLKALGYVPSQRGGSTGVGHTLEAQLQLSENNLDTPDLSEVELKAHRIGSSSMITLFTLDRNVWVMDPLKAIRKFGTPDKDGRLGMYFTMSLTANGSGLLLKITDEAVGVEHTSGEIIARWSTQALAAQFQKKMPALVLVSAKSQVIDGKEQFWYYRARLMRGTSPKLIASDIRAGNILLDLRLHDKGTMARNHGTGFRTYEDRLEKLFTSIEEL